MINRDAAFWNRIASHPQVAPHIFMGAKPESLAPLVEDPANRPMASEHGGLIFLARDRLGLVYELHTLFTPEGWGREVATAARRFFAAIFADASLVLTYEQQGHWRSRPPRSHGWRPCGDFTTQTTPPVRLWSLSRQGWLDSPVGARSQCQSE